MYGHTFLLSICNSSQIYTDYFNNMCIVTLQYEKKKENNIESVALSLWLPLVCSAWKINGVTQNFVLAATKSQVPKL